MIKDNKKAKESIDKRLYIKGIIELFSIALCADKRLTILLIINNSIRNITYPIRVLVVKWIVDLIVLSNTQGFTQQVHNKMLLLLSMFFVLFTLNRIWWPLNAYAQTLALAKISNEIKSRIMKIVCDASLGFFDKTESYNIFQNCITEIEGRRPINVLNNILNFVTKVISISILFVPMMAFNPLLTAMLILSSIPGVLLEKWFGKKLYQFETKNAFNQRRLANIFGLFTNKISAKEIRLFNTGAYLKKQYYNFYNTYVKKLFKLSLTKFYYDIPVWAITQVAGLAAYYVIIYNTSAQNIQLGQMSFFLAAVFEITGAVKDIGNSFNSTVNSSLFMQNLFQLYQNPFIEKKGGGVPESLPVNLIEFKDVSFKYPENEEYALKNISLCFSSPLHIAIVGNNGSGKTTLIKLLLRLYEPSSGEILFNGVNIKEFDYTEWRKIFSVCFQDYYNYAFKACECIGLGNIAKVDSLQDIVIAAQKAGISDTIDNLSNKYETFLSKEYEEEGTELSGGQYSKIALAKTFIGDGSIVILDEPTAALDAKAENEIFQRFDLLTKERLGIMITHRLSSTVNSDVIIVMENGVLAETGTHNQLMEKRGLYYQLFSMQSKRYKIVDNMEDKVVV